MKKESVNPAPKHSPEPWRQDLKERNRVFDSSHQWEAAATFKRPIDAERAVKCVNAMAGVEDPKLWVAAAGDHMINELLSVWDAEHPAQPYPDTQYIQTAEDMHRWDGNNLVEVVGVLKRIQYKGRKGVVYISIDFTKTQDML